MNPGQSPPTASATLTVRPSLPEDVVYLAPRLRKEDLDSVLASGSASADLSLIRGLVYSDICLTAEDQSGNPVLMFGTVANPRDDALGHLWFLASDALDACKPAMLRGAHRYMDTFLQKYTILSSFIDCRASKRRRWLRSCGFEFVGSIVGPGPGGHTFQEAFKLRGD